MESASPLHLRAVDFLVCVCVAVLHWTTCPVRPTRKQSFGTASCKPCTVSVFSGEPGLAPRMLATARQACELKTAASYCFVRLCRCAVLNGAFLGVVVYSLFYIGLEPFAGFTWCLSTGIPCWLTATAFSQHVPYAWAYAIGVHALSWWAQIHVGHIMLEHRKPALLDSFFQVLLRKLWWEACPSCIASWHVCLRRHEYCFPGYLHVTDKLSDVHGTAYHHTTHCCCKRVQSAS